MDRLRDSALTVVAAAGTAVVVAAMVSMPLRGRPPGLFYDLFMWQNGPSGIVSLWMAWLVLRRYPRHGAGLVLLAIGVLQAAHVAVAALLDARLFAVGIDLVHDLHLALTPAELPLDTAVLQLLIATLWVPAATFAMTLLLLVFPDGHLPSPRWRWVVVTAAAGTLLIVVAFGSPVWPTSTTPEPPDLPPLALALFGAGAIGVVVAAVAGLIALIGRWWRADAQHRRPFRVVGATAAACAVLGIVLYPWQVVWTPAVLVAFNALFVAYALAVARYRLHDLEPVLGRAAVGAILTALVAAVYLAIVVGAGSLAGRGFDDPLLPLLAVGVVAILIEPARRRARTLVDRLLYRRHADRTEVLSRLAALAGSAAAEDVLAEVAELLFRSTGAARAEVWLAMERAEQLAASAGTSSETLPALAAQVRNHGELLGELRLYARAAADLVPDAGPLLDDVAHALGVVLRNARLTAQLRAQLDELQRSRQRLVEVHDQTRRGLERDLHDGAQVRLISLRLRLGLASAYAEAGENDALREQLDVLGREVDAAVRSLRDLTRGLHPPILEQSGVAAALRAHVRDLPTAVSVRANGVHRYQRGVEGAVYFACLEAIQNATRHSGARHVTVELGEDSTGLRFTVRDDGIGFDLDRVSAGAGLTNIDDRMSALGGRARIDSAPGHGTTVSGDVPAQPLADDR